MADAHRQALRGATPCRRSGCLPPPRGACLTRAVAAASERGALSAVVSSLRSAVSGTALPSVGPHHPTRERKRGRPPHRTGRTRGCPMSERSQAQRPCAAAEQPAHHAPSAVLLGVRHLPRYVERLVLVQVGVVLEARRPRRVHRQTRSWSCRRRALGPSVGSGRNSSGAALSPVPMPGGDFAGPALVCSGLDARHSATPSAGASACASRLPPTGSAFSASCGGRSMRPSAGARVCTTASACDGLFPALAQRHAVHRCVRRRALAG